VGAAVTPGRRRRI